MANSYTDIGIKLALFDMITSGLDTAFLRAEEMIDQPDQTEVEKAYINKVSSYREIVRQIACDEFHKCFKDEVEPW